MDFANSLPFKLGLLLLALIVVAALALYAYRLTRQVKAQETALAEVGQKGRLEAISSIRALASAMLNGELNITEGAIRIKVMLDYLYGCGQRPTEFDPFVSLHDQTLHHPRRLKRKAIPKKQLRQLDQERERLERQMFNDIQTAARCAKDWDFENDPEIRV